MSATIDFGIDLGTTNSSVALCRRGEVRVFQTTDLMNVTPSVVYISKTGRMLVGKKAYDTWVQDPQNTQAEFKRWMGYSDTLKFPASGKVVTAEELSAELLKSLRADAERQTQEKKVTAAVITVPAAFGSLQCDATGRAARMAGFELAPLLQEPIAAAVAYGAAPSSRDQRWMVFDFGGGTLDIAIVSTRNGRLAVLEHQGNNRLGGKDIDRTIAQELLWTPLSATYRLPDANSDPLAYQRLMRVLVRQAEQAKISLSTAPEATVELYDIGEDLDGKPIELSLTLRRSEMEAKMTPILDQCMELARRALEGARVSAADLDRVLLVGGPTQMPVVRAALESQLGAKLEHSLDPMTVVSHGAALFASTLENTTTPAPAAVAAAAKAAAGAVPIQLAYERASGTAQSPVGGVIPAGSGVHEVKIDAASGFWTSGWLPVVRGSFQTEVILHDNKPVTHFRLSARDTKGNPVRIDPAEFTITFMLPMSAAPLPHTIAIELSTSQGVTSFDPVFKRHCPLPAEVRKTYRADRPLRPSEVESTLPIKFWEIEVSADPQERWWAGCVHVNAHSIKRPITEGMELELTIKIDASRKMSVELFIPLLNQAFAHDVYLPDPPSARSQVQEQLDICFERLDAIRRVMYETDRGDVAPRFNELQRRAETIAEQVGHDRKRGETDPDASLNATDALRRLRMQLMQLEEQLNLTTARPGMAQKMRSDVRYISSVVAEHGTDLDRADFEKLKSQYEQYAESGDVRGLKYVHDQIWPLHGRLMTDKMWYWQERFEYLKSPAPRFLNQAQAANCLAEGDSANTRGDLAGLRSAVRKLWGLIAPDQLEKARDQETQSGLRST